MQVLIAEDDDSVASALVAGLSRYGHQCERVSRGSDVLLQHRRFDALLLDLGLADTEGFDVLRKLRAVSELPVIVVTARGDERSTVLALRLGADDYLVKPVRLAELLARLDVVTRRREREAAPDIIAIGEVTVDLAARRVRAGDTDIALTPTEFAVLAVLTKSAGQAVSRERILDEVWGDAYTSTSRTFDVHLAQLRHKLPTDIRITTIRGFGYRLEDN